MKTLSFLAVLAVPVLAVPAGADSLSDDAFARVVAPDAEVKTLSTGYKFTEGPVWNARGFWIFSDQNDDSLFKVTPEGQTALIRRPSSNTNGNTYDQMGRLVSCEQAPMRRVARKKADGTFETLADRFEGKRFNSPNDLAIRSDGSIYFTDPSYGLRGESAELDFRGLYRIFPDGRVELLDKEWDQPNGVTFSPDEKMLYVCDSGQGTIYSYDVDETGALSSKTLLATLPRPGAPDGMKTDFEGRLYVAGPGGAWIFAPRGGLLGKIPTPKDPANLAFGGKDGDILMMTARDTIFSVQLKVAGPAPHKANE